MVNDIDFDYDAAKAGHREAQEEGRGGSGDRRIRRPPGYAGENGSATPLKMSVDSLGKGLALGRPRAGLGEMESVFRSLERPHGARCPRRRSARAIRGKTSSSWACMPGVGGNVDIKIRSTNHDRRRRESRGRRRLRGGEDEVRGSAGSPGEKKEEPQPPGIEAKIKTDGEGEGKTTFSITKGPAPLKSQRPAEGQGQRLDPQPRAAGTTLDLKSAAQGRDRPRRWASSRGQWALGSRQ